MDKTKKKNRKFINHKNFKRSHTTSPNAVINLSNTILNNHELSLLSKGLSFCPTPSKTDPLELHRDIHLFNRRLRLAYFFQDQTNSFVPNPFRPQSGWVPRNGINSDLDTFINITSFLIGKPTTSTATYSNLSQNEIKALTSLRNNHNIVIKSADKGGAIVIMNRKDYLLEAERQLYNPEHYSEVQSDLTPNIIKEINNFIQRVKQHLSKELTIYNTIKTARTPLFYLLPKIHKPGNPGRPIVSATGGPTEKLSATVDYFLKPLAQKVDSYLQDTKDFLNKINSLGRIPPHSLLVTADVSALYTSIPHRDGILTAKKALDTRVILNPPTWILLRFLHFVLTKNCFSFNNKHYLQIQGTSMGTICAPNYAIIFMDNLETTFLQSQPLVPLVWWRYIDDIFFIWTHPRKDLDTFMVSLNRHHPTILFTHEINAETIHFLDTTIIKTKDGILQSTLYTKPTDANLYLHYSSCHPNHQKRNIPLGQALRIRRICSTLAEFDRHCRNLLRNFLMRGYPRPLLETAILKARNTDRSNLLLTDTGPSQNIIPFIITFNPKLPPISSIFKEHEGILRQKPSPYHRLTVAFRRPPNLKNCLVRTDINFVRPDIGSKPCGKPCSICRYMTTSTTVTSHSNQKTVRIHHSINCNTYSAIYVIQCKQCHKQYVGQTSNSIRERFTGHRADIKSANEYKPVSRHFTSPSHSINDVTITGLMVTENNVNIRLRTEEAWIAILNTTEPSGLNIRHGKN